MYQSGKVHEKAVSRSVFPVQAVVEAVHDKFYVVVGTPLGSRVFAFYEPAATEHVVEPIPDL